MTPYVWTGLMILLGLYATADLDALLTGKSDTTHKRCISFAFVIVHLFFVIWVFSHTPWEFWR